MIFTCDYVVVVKKKCILIRSSPTTKIAWGVGSVHNWITYLTWCSCVCPKTNLVAQPNTNTKPTTTQNEGRVEVILECEWS